MCSQRNNRKKKGFNFKYEIEERGGGGVGDFKYLNRPQESDYVNGISYTQTGKEVEKSKRKWNVKGTMKEIL